MANSIILPLLLLLLASSASARPGLPFHPCKTLLISTYSVSFQPRHPDPLHPHPRPDFIAVVAELRSFRPDFVPENPQFRPHRLQDETLIPHPHHHRHHPDLPLGSTASFGDRTLDLLNVLASLLFGAACGALTAGTMYIIWSLFTTRFESYQSLDDFSDDDDDDDDDDIFNPKKPLNTTTTTTIKNADEAVVVVAVPAPSSSADSAQTALLNKESA